MNRNTTRTKSRSRGSLPNINKNNTARRAIAALENRDINDHVNRFNNTSTFMVTDTNATTGTTRGTRRNTISSINNTARRAIATLHFRNNNNNNNHHASRNSISSAGSNTTSTSTITNNTVVTFEKKKINMSKEKRIDLYNKTFDRNGNQLTLQSKNIVMKKPNKDGRDEYIDIDVGPDGLNYENLDGSMYLKMSLERSALQKGSIKSIKVGNSIQNIVSVRSTRSVCIDRNKNNNGGSSLIPGTCIICFEEFAVGDVVVWSETKLCNHLYHKNCLVPYLAHNAQPMKSSDVRFVDNPCPTCRQKYCTVPIEYYANAEELMELYRLKI